MTQQIADKLSEALKLKFGGDVEADLVGDGQYRFAIVSPDFQPMTQMQRQDEVWAEVDRVVDRDSTLDITLILTYAPKELDLINVGPW